MAGASFVHGLLVTRLGANLVPQLHKHGCVAVSSDIRVLVAATGLYTYPDFVIVYGKPEFSGADNLLNPA